MKVWLINPPVLRCEASTVAPVIRSLFYNSPPLGLAYMAAVLEQDGHRVVITDCPVERYTIEDLSRLAPRLQPDVIGLTATTSYYDVALAAAQAVQRVCAGVPLVLGGPHITVNPELLLTDTVFDYGVVGEGEWTLREMVARLAVGRSPADVPGVVTANAGRVQAAAPRPLIDDLDDLPPPARHLVPMRKYRPVPNDQNRLPKTTMITSRGCPYGCVFCDKAVFGRRYRSFSPARIVAEMHAVEHDYGIRDIAFCDSTFTPTRRRIEGVLTAMEADPPRATWTASCRADVLEEDILRRMRAMNCWRVRIAVESGNDRILRGIGKDLTKEQFARAAWAAYRAGLQVKAFFMVGHIGETRETLAESIEFARSLPLKDVTVQINTPMRGTVQYEQCRQHGTLLTQDGAQYTYFQPVFVPKDLTVQELLAGHRRFYRRFYLRPIIFWRHLAQIRRWSDVTKYFRALPLLASLFMGRSLPAPPAE